jgi:hypothetical protein
MASLGDILTTQKNGVVAINALQQYLGNMYNIFRGTPVTPTAATTSVSTLYTVPANTQFLLTDIEICNTVATAGTFNIYLVPSGGTAAQSNALFYAAPINGYTTVQWTGQQSLGAGYTVQALASATTITIKVSGSAQ